MSLFFLTFFLIYGGTHLYFFLKVKAALSPGIVFSLFLALFLLLMVITPVLVRILENKGLETIARVAAYTGYLWMGFFFLFFSASLAMDIYHGLLHVAGFIFRRDFSTLYPGKPHRFNPAACMGTGNGGIWLFRSPRHQDRTGCHRHAENSGGSRKDHHRPDFRRAPGADHQAVASEADHCQDQ